MLRLLLDKINRWRNKHVCDEWTQWERKKGDYERTHYYDGLGNLETLAKPVITTRHWQERRCTQCGLIQQRELEH